MSYDFELYTSNKNVPAPPSTSAGSNILFDGPNNLESDDIPDDYISIVGKKKLLFTIHLEGALTNADQKLVDKWLSSIVRSSKGVLIDLQTNAYEMTQKRGVIEPKETKFIRNGEMTFYFTDGEGFYQHGFEQMLNCIAATMPEVLPKRYGSYEPLQERLENDSFSELVKAFHENPNISMKGKAPFGHILLSIPCKKRFERFHPKHFSRRKFLMGKVDFELKPKLFTNPSKFILLRKLFENLCILLDVAYAEITETEGRSSSWFWYGLPENEPHTICIGSAYRSVWPEFVNLGEKLGEHHLISSTDRFGNSPPHPPNELVAPSQEGIDLAGGKPDYAKIFPFDYIFDYKKYIW